MKKSIKETIMGMGSNLDRRDFLKGALAVGAGLALHQAIAKAEEPIGVAKPGNVAGLTAPPVNVVRAGFVGVGGRGTGDMIEFLKCDGVEVNAVCDIVPAKVDCAAGIVEKKQHRKPVGYSSGPEDFKRLCQRDDIDSVFICTPWEWHVPMAVYAMQCGKHAFMEVSAAMNIADCWQLVETAEKTRKHCMMLENCCYGESELMVLNMVRQGVFGDLTHGEAGYIHDLRDLKLSGQGEGAWRTQWSVDHNGNLYPTHGLGPVAQYMNINRGDRFDYLTSMSSPAMGLHQASIKKFGPNHPMSKIDYKCGDMNTTIIKTAKGRTIMVQHDTTSPRPYSRINLISGTLGTFSGYPDRIALSPNSHEWQEVEEYRKKYRHPLIAKAGEKAKGAGHGGMDFIMMYRLVDCLHRGLPLDMDVYDAAAWSCIVECSEKSVANRGNSVDIPDFTRGAWKTTLPLGIVS
jgi:hypothetical protein